MDKGPLGRLPTFENFVGFIDLKSGAYIVAALGMVHIIFFGCTCFMPLSYHLVTIWLLVATYSGFSTMLLYAVYIKDDFLMSLWIWYSLIFVVLMYFLMSMFVCVFCSRKEVHRIFLVFLALSWYALTVYFIFVVNSYRMKSGLKDGKNLNN